MFGIGGVLTFAALFWFAASYEHLTPWKWALASVAITLTINGLFPGSFIFVLPGQFGLFLVMWWAHVKNQAKRAEDLEQRQKDEQRIRRERVSRAQAEADATTDWDAREAERVAVAEKAERERKDRVRVAREQREREERERGPEGTGGISS